MCCNLSEQKLIQTGLKALVDAWWLRLGIVYRTGHCWRGLAVIESNEDWGKWSISREIDRMIDEKLEYNEDCIIPESAKICVWWWSSCTIRRIELHYDRVLILNINKGVCWLGKLLMEYKADTNKYYHKKVLQICNKVSWNSFNFKTHTTPLINLINSIFIVVIMILISKNKH